MLLRAHAHTVCCKSARWKQIRIFARKSAFSTELDREFYTLRISGRADGVFTSAAGICIQEIKTTYLPLEELTPAHYPAYHAQLDTYGYLCALENGLKQITLRLTYYQLQQKKERSFERTETFETLKQRFNALTEDYFRISDNAVRHRLSRNQALRNFSFPFASYRPSQHEFAAQVYTCIKQGNTLFAQAPTGTGKTIGTLFPALKAARRRGFAIRSSTLRLKIKPAQSRRIRLSTSSKNPCR